MSRSARWVLPVVVALALTGAACDDNPTPSQPGGPDNAATGEPVGSVGDPCGLLTSADIKAALGADVVAVKRLAQESDEDGTRQLCAFAITGTGLDASGLGFLNAAAGGAAGDLPTGAAVGVVRFQATPDTDPQTDPDPDELPPGAKLIDVGRNALLVPGPTGGGAALVQMTEDTGFYLLVVREDAVTADQLETLARAAAARF